MPPPGYPKTPKPTLSGYLNKWLYGTVGIPQMWLTPDNEWIDWSFNTAVGTVNWRIERVPGPFYLQAIYNLGAHVLLTNCPDNPNLPPYMEDTTGSYGYFGWYRKQNNVDGSTLGTVTASSDESTSVSLTVPKQAENLTLAQLQLQTTPYGRAYLGIAQSYGTNWGIS